MLVSLIVAMARNRVIGVDNHLPWHLPEDLRRFRAATLGKPILMGRRTFESIGRALPGRTNLVLTRARDLSAPGAQSVHSIAEALEAAAGAVELVVIGGAEVYRATLPLARRIYLTRVDADIAGDTYFPELDAVQWGVSTRAAQPADAQHAHALTFETLERD
jgi:dihydrofolate reductase